jgi:hypothetical protein
MARTFGTDPVDAPHVWVRQVAAKQALTKFATCMREHGVNVPTPSTSGKGPVFDIRGLNTKSATSKTAESKCSSTLRGAFRAHPGAGRRR